MQFRLKQRSVLPGFNLALGYTLLYMGLIVLITNGGVHQNHRPELDGVLGDCDYTSGAGVLPADLWRFVHRCNDQH